MATAGGEKYGDSIEPIAIVGMACRFPGDVSTPGQFWDMLEHQRSGHSEVPADRFKGDVWRHPDFDRRGAIQPSSGFFLSQDVSLFDAPFFSITAKEAMGMDPMQRQLLEVAYECFENAGVPMEKLPGSSTSVYTGVMTGDYERMTQGDIFHLPLNAASGTSRAMLSNRLSWFFNLAGASLTLDTACSSSLYALHLACQSIRLGESQQALVTGVNLMLDPNLFSQLSQMHMLSPDGISHSFDHRANGYARGESVGAVLVKPLHRALADGDTIRAIIRGSGANQDGKTPGITMPSSDAQGNLIEAVYTAAGLSRADTSYFEAHGTGTKIGDPIELSAIGKGLGTARPKGDRLYVGSVKTNVGHTEGMAGLAGVIKTTLALEKAALPGLVGFEKLNPRLLLDDWNLALPLETMPWPTAGLRRASVNSFGFGGANAHVVLDDAFHYLQSHNLEGRHYTLEKPTAPNSSSPAQISNCEGSQSEDYKLLPFSMQDQSGIDRLSKSLAAYLTLDPTAGERPEIDMDDLAFTLADRRSQFNIRSYSVSKSIKELATSDLKSLATMKQKPRGQPENLIFVFSGQGAQWPLMGRELMSRPVFAESMARSQKYLEDLGCTWDAVEVLRDPGPKINAAEFCQPMCTILQVALVDLLASWEIHPCATIGHSSGEMAAAYAAGAIDQRATVKIGYMRGYYCAQLPSRLKERRGCMMAAGLTPQEAEHYLRLVDEGAVVVACINSPVSVTLSGDMEGISYLEAQIQADGKFARKLRVEVAYHSPHMREVSQDFLESLGTIETAPKFKALMFSSVTTKEVRDPSVLDAAYWVKNMVSAVHFSEAADSLLNHSIANAKTKKKTFVNWFAAVELGPHEALKGPFNQCVSNLKGKRSKEIIPYMSMIRRGQPGDKTAAEAAGLLWSLGHPIDVLKVNNVEPDRVMKAVPFLPPYPWQHSKGFWIEPRNHEAARMKSSPRTDLLGVEIDNQNPHEPHWKNVISLSENPWMRDHTITGTILYPAAGMLVMALEAVLQIAKSQERKVRGVEFHDVRFDRGLVVPETDDAVETSLSIKPHEMLESWFHWTLFSRVPGGTYQRHAWGLISMVDDGENEGNKVKGSRWQVEAAKFSSVRTRAMSSVDTTAFYDQLRTIGMDYGPLFTNLTSAGAIENENAGYGVIKVPDTKSVMPGDFEYPHVIHPATLDAIFHLVFIALFEGKPMPESSIPVTVEKIFIATEQPSGSGAEYVGFATAKKINDRDYSGSLVTSNADWQAPKVIVNNMVVRKVSSSDDSSVAMQMATVPKRVGEMRWMEDLDLLDVEATNRIIQHRAQQQTAISRAVAWLELACHKHPNIKALAVVDDTRSADLVAEVVSGFAPTPDGERKFSKLSVKSTTEDVYFYLTNHPMLKGLDIDIDTIAPMDENSPPAPKGENKSDLLIVHADTQSRLVSDRLADLAPKLGSNGTVLAFGPEVANAESHLRKNGFDTPSARLMNGTGPLLAVSRPRKAHDSEEGTIYVLQSAKPSGAVIHLRKSLDEAFAKSGITLETKLLGEIADIKGQQLISLLEVEEPLVIKWSAEEFEQFQNLVFSQSYVLWVTRGGYLESGDDSLQFAPTTGLLRTMRTEIPQIIMPHLDLSPSTDLESPLTAGTIAQIFETTVNPKSSSGEDIETEYVECNGVLHIPRILGNMVLDGELNAHAEKPTPVPTPLSKRHERPLHFVPKGTSSSLAEYQWVEDGEAMTAIGDDQVEIITEYVAVDAAGMGGTRGTTPKESMGQTASGSVSRVGADVQEISIGDKVFFPVLEGRALKTQLRQQRHLVNRVPSGVPLADAPRLLNSVVNAYHCLHNVARIGHGESVLLHMLNHDLAYAAFSIAKAKGARVFHSVESKEVQEILVNKYYVAEHRIFDSSGSDMAQNLLDATNGRGFDVILSDYTGVSRRQASACVAENGQYVDLSGNFVVAEMSMDVFDKNVSISSNDVWRLRQTALGDLFQEAAKLLAEDDSFSRAPRGSIFSVGSMDRAWEYLNELFHSSLTIHFDDDALISTVPSRPASLALDPKATYIIAGGLGALGLAIAENMASNGARHLVLLSRSGVPKTPRQKKGVDSMKDQGCKVDTLACDVSDEQQVRNMIKEGQESGWSIKGLIQCAMVLYDGIFENMKYEDWVNSLRPKVRGTWHLHSHLPQDLDFFIILSSVSGIIGNAAQANYAAGNNYEDAIAHYRHARGLASTTMNVGIVTDASHFETDGVFNMTSEEWLQTYPNLVPTIVTVREVQLVLNAVMRGDTTVPAQVQVGLSGEVPRGPDSMCPWSKERKFDHRIKKQTDSDSSGEGQKISLANELDAAESAQEVVAAITQALKAHVAVAMTAAPEDIDSEKPLYSFGIDSLKAINVRNWVFKEVKADISVFDILSPTPLGQLAVNLAKKSSLVRPELVTKIEQEGY